MEEKRECEHASSCGRESCEGCPSKTGEKTSFQVEANAYSSIGKVIGVVSGKGGVGKSFVTAAMANAMAKRGYRVGILDADITGPSIPKMYGIHEQAMGSELGLLPIESSNDIKIMSLNLLVEDEETPVIWRGPVIAGTVKQFWSDVYWGELDYLFVDMPPGTGDVPLTVFQSLPVDGIILVTSPQELVQLIVKKALRMAEMMNIPVLGIVENYSYITCPDCGKEISLFGKSRIDETAAELDLPVFAKLPLNPEYAHLSDEGRFAEMNSDLFDGAAEVLRGI